MELFFYSNSVNETFEIGMEIAKLIGTNTVVAINGNLGAGKTQLIKGICKYYDCKSEVLSPTFSLLNIYSGRNTVYHFDFYRIKSLTELYDIGIEEYIQSNGIVLIEWAELFPGIIPVDSYFINIQKCSDSETKRIIQFNKP